MAENQGTNFFEEDKRLDPTCELFRVGDPEFRSLSYLSRVWLPTAGVATGLAFHGVANFMQHRPLRAGMQKYAIYGVLGFYIGEWMWRTKMAVMAEKDLQYYHYMTLHPEDFPPPRKVLFRDYLEPWIPVR